MADIEHLEAQAEQAWNYAHGSEHENLSKLLRTLIPNLEYAVRRSTGSDRQRACVA